MLKRPSFVRLSAISDHCWFANVEVDSTDVNMLIDTGSAVTLISKEKYVELNRSFSDLSVVKSKLATADGEPLRVSGETVLPICIGDKIYTNSVIVAELGGMPGILGLDFLSKNLFVFDTGNGRLRSPDVDVQLHKDGFGARCARVHLLETVHIPGCSEMFVTGEIRGHFSGTKDGCLEPLEKFRGSEHLIMPKAVADTSKSQITFSIMNPTPEIKILKKNIQVATLHPVEQVLQCELVNIKSDTTKCNAMDTRVSAVASVEQQELPEHLQQLIHNTSSTLSKEQKSALTKVVHDFSDIFVGPGGDLGQTALFEHTIDTGDARPIKLPPRRLPITQREVRQILKWTKCRAKTLSKRVILRGPRQLFSSRKRTGPHDFVWTTESSTL